MTEIILTPEQCMGTVFGAAFVFALLGFLVAYFSERAYKAEEELEWVMRNIEHVKK